jgi:hypothetical protein
MTDISGTRSMVTSIVIVTCGTSTVTTVVLCITGTSTVRGESAKSLLLPGT